MADCVWQHRQRRRRVTHLRVALYIKFEEQLLQPTAFLLRRRPRAFYREIGNLDLVHSSSVLGLHGKVQKETDFDSVLGSAENSCLHKKSSAAAQRAS